MLRKEDLVSVPLARRLSVSGVTLMGVGVLIGGGLYTLLGFAAHFSGWALPIVMVLNALITINNVMAYAELSTARPETGGGYTWIREGIGRTQGFFSGWISWGAHSVACALYALSFSFYAAELLFNIFLPALGVESELADADFLRRSFAAGMIILLGGVNILGAGKVGWFGSFITILQVGILGTFIGAGIFTIAMNPEGLGNFGGPIPEGQLGPFSWGGFGMLSGMALIYIAFEGSEIVAQTSEELKNPERNLPKALFYSFGIVVAIYIAVAFVAVAGIPEIAILENAGEGAMVDIASHFLLPGGAVLLTIGGVFAGLAALNGTIYSSSHVSYAMGVSRQLPAFLAATNKRFRTQHWAIIASLSLIVFMAIRFPIQDVASVADILFIALFAQLHWALIRYRKEQPDLHRPFKVWFYPWSSYFVILVYVILLPFFWHVSPVGVGIVVVWMILGALVYFPYTRRKEEAVITEQEVMKETIFDNVEEGVRGYRIILALGDAERSEEVWQPYAKIVHALSLRHQPAEIYTVRVHVVPPARRLNSVTSEEIADEVVFTRQVAQYLATLVGEKWQGRIRDDVIRARSVTEGILEVLEEYNADLLILGWRGSTRTRGRVFGESIDQLLYRVRCDLVFVKLSDLTHLGRVLLPSAGGQHARFAASVAAALASYSGGGVTLLRVVPPALPSQDQDALLAHTKEDLHWQSQDRLEERLVAAASPAAAIVREANGHEGNPGYDAVVMAASRGRLFKEMLVGNVPETVAELSDKTVIIVKHHSDIGKPVLRLIRERFF